MLINLKHIDYFFISNFLNTSILFTPLILRGIHRVSTKFNLTLDYYRRSMRAVR